MTSTVHDLKCWPVYWDATERGDKPFDVRRDDRGFQKGDIVRLHKFNPDSGTYWRQERSPKQLPPLVRRITWILTGGQFGIEPGYVVLGYGHIQEGSAQ